MKLCDICKDAPSIDVVSNLKDAVSIFLKSGGGVIVVLDGSKPVGVVSSFDVLEMILTSSKPDSTRVKEMMNPSILVLDAYVKLQEAAKIMLAHKHWMAVVTENGEYRGVVTAQGLLTALI